MAVHSFAFVSLFPYVGIMVTELLDLDTTNKAGTREKVQEFGLTVPFGSIFVQKFRTNVVGLAGETLLMVGCMKARVCTP